MVAVLDQYRVNHQAYAGGQLGLMASKWKVTNVTGASITDAEVAAGFGTGPFAAAIKALMAPGADYIGVSIQRYLPVPVGLTVVNNTSAGPGLATGDLLPSQTRGLFKLTTDLGGPRYRGRKYVPFPSEADNAATGLPTAGYILRLATFAALLATAIVINGAGGTATFSPIIYHRGVLPDNTLITGFVTRTSWGTQRRSGSLGRPNLRPF